MPLVVGDAAPQEVAQLLRELWDGPETLIIVSSDLSHYNSYETAQRLDLSTAEAIEQGEWASLGSRRACGWVAVAGLLIETQRRELGGYRLALCNSGDTAGSRDRVVGYGAWMFGEVAVIGRELNRAKQIISSDDRAGKVFNHEVLASRGAGNL